MRQDAPPLIQKAQVMPARRASAWHGAAVVAFGLLIVALPLARHWVLLQRPPFHIYNEFTSFVLYLSDVAVILLLASVALWLWREKQSALPATGFALNWSRAQDRWGPAAITLPLALLPALAFVTVPWAGDPALALYFASRLVVLLLVYLAIVALQPPMRAVRFSLTASLIVQASIAVTQFAIQDDLGWRQLGEIELNPTSGYASIIQVGNQIWLRGYGLTPHPNILGGILTATVLALIVPYLESRSWRKAGWLAILMLGVMGLVVTFSRAAWLGALAGGAVLLLGVLANRTWRQKYGRAFLVPALAGLVLLTGFILARRDLFLARFEPLGSQTESRSLVERRILADKSLVLVRRSPLTGVGAGNFSTAVAPLVAAIPETTPQPVHNLPLLASAELGLAGGALWIWLMLAPLVLAWQRLRSGELTLWALALTAALVALAMVDLFDFYSWGWPQGRLLRWIYFGLWAGAVTDHVAPQPHHNS